MPRSRRGGRGGRSSRLPKNNNAFGPSPKPNPSSSAGSSSVTTSSQESIPSNSKPKYDVFVTFRGSDARETLFSHLYVRLCERSKLNVYSDEVDLKRGVEITKEVLEEVERSDVYVVILSPNYAKSTWCLEELQKMFECAENSNRKIIPVTYKITFNEFEKKLPKSIAAQSWVAELGKLSGRSGFDSSVIRREAELVKQITEAVIQAIRGSKRQREMSSYAAEKGLVRLDWKIEEVDELVRLEDESKKVIGLWGTPGMGKTTLARAFYYLSDWQFEGVHFISDFAHKSLGSVADLRNECFSKLLNDAGVRRPLSERSLEQFLLNSKVLLVIDDVGDDEGKLNDLFLGCERYYDLFGAGSKIILTGTNKHLLTSVCDAVYEFKGLRTMDGFELFKRHAFSEGKFHKEYYGVCGKLMGFVGGNPKAIKALAGRLRDRDLDTFYRELGALQDNHANPRLQDVFNEHHNGLSPEEKEVFLDLACFHEYWALATLDKLKDTFLDDRSRDDIQTLLDKGLLTIGAYDRRVQIEFLQKDFARNFVNKERDIGKRSRLWAAKDIYQLFKENKGSQFHEGIVLHEWDNVDSSKWERSISIKPDAFAKMKNLRFLIVDRDDCNPPENGLECLPNALKILHWPSFNSKCLPPQFSAENVVHLVLRNSELETLWECEDKDNVRFRSLKFLILEGSKSLKELPDLSTAKKLELINLKECESLEKLPTSILELSKLKYVDVTDCIKLTLDNFEKILPPEGDASYLYTLPSPTMLFLGGTLIKKVPSSIGRRLNIKWLACLGCTALIEFPVIPSLEDLVLTGSSIKEVVELEKLTALKSLGLSNNKQLAHISDTDCSKLISLTELKLDGCSKLSSLPDSIGHIIHLESLDLSCTAITVLPPSIGKLIHLESLDLSCSAVTELPPSIGDLVRLEKLILKCCKSLVSLPDTIQNLPILYELNMVGCDQLSELPELPSSLKKLDAYGCKLLHTLSPRKPDFSNTECNFAQCWNLDRRVCNELVDKFVQDSVRVSQRSPFYFFMHKNATSRLSLPVKWGSSSTREPEECMTVEAEFQRHQWTNFCAVLDFPDPDLMNQGYYLVVECVMPRNKDSSDDEKGPVWDGVVVSDSHWKFEDQEKDPSYGLFLTWSTCAFWENNTGSVSFQSYYTKDIEERNDRYSRMHINERYLRSMKRIRLKLIKSCAVFPVHDNRKQEDDTSSNEDDSRKQEEDTSLNDHLLGLYDKMCIDM